LVLIRGVFGVNERGIAQLTERQKDCLRLVGQGFTSKEIGRALDLSPSTVDNHVASAVQVLNAINRGSAARALAAFEAGQKLPRQPHDLVAAQSLSDHSLHREATDSPSKSGSILSLPPVGGQRNDLDGSTRSLRILQVAVVAAAVAIALTIMVAGLFRTFG
jgi:DNA-binding CsgD family transcriptional regulator